jgi:hypothetical protein
LSRLQYRFAERREEMKEKRNKNIHGAVKKFPKFFDIEDVI